MLQTLMDHRTEKTADISSQIPNEDSQNHARYYLVHNYI